MANQYVNKLIKDGVTKFDLTSDTVTPETLAEGVTAHDASGKSIIGVYSSALDEIDWTEYGLFIIPPNSKPDSEHTSQVRLLIVQDKLTQADYKRYTGIEAVFLLDNGKIVDIPQAAFFYCTSLTSITIPNSVTSIGSEAFDHCASLTNITIPNSVTSIGSWAFNRCSSLASITIPDSVTKIGGYAFNGCTSLKTITINKPQDSISGAPWGATNATVVWTG